MIYIYIYCNVGFCLFISEGLRHHTLRKIIQSFISINSITITSDFISNNTQYKLRYYARRPNNDLLPFEVSLVDAADDKAPPRDPRLAQSHTYTRTLWLRTLSESLAKLHETKDSKEQSSEYPRVFSAAGTRGPYLRV